MLLHRYYICSGWRMGKKKKRSLLCACEWLSVSPIFDILIPSGTETGTSVIPLRCTNTYSYSDSHYRSIQFHLDSVRAIKRDEHTRDLRDTSAAAGGSLAHIGLSSIEMHLKLQAFHEG
jgi:hypothetical protein